MRLWLAGADGRIERFRLGAIYISQDVCVGWGGPAEKLFIGCQGTAGDSSKGE